MPTVLLELPETLRGALKDPLGPIYTDAEALLADAGEPIVAVGDVVTYHLIGADRWPDVALVDGKTKRERVDREVLAAIEGFDRRVAVENPPATLTEELLAALVEALASPGTTVISVEGEEDLAALPAVVAAPDGASVVYGQPGEGMVLATVEAALRTECRELLAAMDGDVEAVTDRLAR